MIEMAVLITMFWDCEVSWLRAERSAQSMLACIEIAEVIKHQQFQGDFDQYLRWWRENRDREYAERGYSRDR